MNNQEYQMKRLNLTISKMTPHNLRMKMRKKALLNFLNLKQIKKKKSRIFLQVQDNKMYLTQKINRSSLKIKRKKTKFITKSLTNHLNPYKMSQKRM